MGYRSLAAGRGSLFLDELHEFEAGIEEAVDAIGETRLFGARKAGRRCAGYTPGFLVSHGGGCGG